MKQIRQISEREYIKYGDFNNPFRKYDIDMLRKQGRDELVRNDRKVQRFSYEQLEELSTDGISQEMLDNLGCINKNIDTFIDSQIDAIKKTEI
jgi:hypothetical protein